MLVGWRKKPCRLQAGRERTKGQQRARSRTHRALGAGATGRWGAGMGPPNSADAARGARGCWKPRRPGKHMCNAKLG